MDIKAISSVRKKLGKQYCDYTVKCFVGDQMAASIHELWLVTSELVNRRIKMQLNKETSRFECEISKIKAGTEISFEIVSVNGLKSCIVPIEEPDTVFGKPRIPNIDPTLKFSGKDKSQESNSLNILLETTLEGLLADYQGGIHFPASIEQLLELSIAARINKTRIPKELSEMGYTEVMVPILSSVADRTQLNPKFNYLVYNLSVDWQLGNHKEMRDLVQHFRNWGIEVIPDLVFAHQVTDPYDGSPAEIEKQMGCCSIYKDSNPFLFRDYGTWMFNLEQPEVRCAIVEKITLLVTSLDLRKIRVDYIDGLILQYSNRSGSYGEQLLNELKLKLSKECPDLEVIGEAFQTASSPSVQSFITSAYSPRGFKIIETLLRPGYPDVFHIGYTVDTIIKSLQDANSQSSRESNYSQMHDECWSDEWIQIGRPSTPWAYGKMPLGLALDRINQLIDTSLLSEEEKMSTAIRMADLISILGLSMSFNRWMETSGGMSMDTGRLDQADHWKFLWNSNDRLNHKIWDVDQSSRHEIIEQFNNHRHLLASTRKKFLSLGSVPQNPPGPPIQIIHSDFQNGIIAYLRWGSKSPLPLLVIANLSPYTQNKATNYEITNQIVQGKNYSQIQSTSKRRMLPFKLIPKTDNPSISVLTECLLPFQAIVMEETA